MALRVMSVKALKEWLALHRASNRQWSSVHHRLKLFYILTTTVDKLSKAQEQARLKLQLVREFFQVHTTSKRVSTRST